MSPGKLVEWYRNAGLIGIRSLTGWIRHLIYANKTWVYNCKPQECMRTNKNYFFCQDQGADTWNKEWFTSSVAPKTPVKFISNETSLFCRLTKSQIYSFYIKLLSRENDMVFEIKFPLSICSFFRTDLQQIGYFNIWIKKNENILNVYYQFCNSNF